VDDAARMANGAVTELVLPASSSSVCGSSASGRRPWELQRWRFLLQVGLSASAASGPCSRWSQRRAEIATAVSAAGWRGSRRPLQAYAEIAAAYWLHRVG
jgi:hypothetical protein